MRLVVLLAANRELMESLTWLVDRGRYRVMHNLWDAWERGLDAISETPRRFPPFEPAVPDREVRQCLLLGARYRIIFQILPEEIRVVAFGRTSRSDDHWQGRVE
jgi:plasmid stabilization system protein ParE